MQLMRRRVAEAPRRKGADFSASGGIGREEERGTAMMPLHVALPGEETIIRKIGGSPEVKKHLEDLGFVVGGSVTLLTVLNGNVIVNVKESRIALDADMARRIMI